MLIGDRIKEERERLGYSQEAFAVCGGVSKRSQIMYEQNKTEAGAGYFTLIAKIGVNVQYILTGEGEMSKGKPPCAEISPRIARMAELLDGLNEDQQREVFAAVAEKKRLNTLEATIAELLKRTA